MAPKTRSQGGASPAPELQAAPPRTRARKPKPVNPKSALSLTADPSSRTQAESVVATSGVTNSRNIPSPIAPSPITNPSTSKVSGQKLLHSKNVGPAGLSSPRLLRRSNVVEQLIKDTPPSPYLNHSPGCVHCHHRSFNPNDVPLIAPSIVHPKTNYTCTSTQTSVEVLKASVLTVEPAQTPVKRTREESAGDVEDGPATKRHQSNPTRTSTSTGNSLQLSRQAPRQTSNEKCTQTNSSTASGKPPPSTPAPTPHKRTTMTSITQAKSRTKSPQPSPVARSNVDSLQINRNMTWGQMTRVHSRRVKLAGAREQQTQPSRDEEVVDKKAPLSSPSATPQAPSVPQTAPQPRTGLFGSIRKALEFVPQLPASVTKSIFSNPFAPTRSEAAVEPQHPESPSPEEPVISMEADSSRSGPGQDPDESRPLPQRTRHVLGPRVRLSSSAGNPRPVRVGADTATAHANAGHSDTVAHPSSQKRKRKGFGLYFDEASYSSDDFSESDSPTGESSAPEAKKQKLDDTHTPRSVLKRRAATSASTLPRTSKRVTFDDSPLDTPSKIRSRSFEYTGTTFADAPNQSYTSPASDDESTLSNSPGTKANTKANTPCYYEAPKYPPLPEDYVLPPDFTPTSANPRPGTFCLDFNTYDENDDEIDWDAPVDAIHSNIVVGDPDTPTAVQTPTTNIADLATTPEPPTPPATPRIAHAELPAMTSAPAGINIHADVDARTLSPPKKVDANVLADVTQEQINRVRSTAEQHKSKNPSRLSQVEHATSVSPPAADAFNEFDAGWPKPKSYVEAGICSQRIFDLVNKDWDPRDSVIGEMVYQQDLKEWIEAHRLEQERGVPVKVHWGDEEDDALHTSRGPSG